LQGPATQDANKASLLPVLPEKRGFDELFKAMRANLAHADFNDLNGRARTERPPVIGGKSLNDYGDVKLLQDGRPVGESAGRIYHVSMIENPELREAYGRQEKQYGRQGMERVGDPIRDKSRPGLLSESAVEAMPPEFRAAGLERELQSHQLAHGSGTSRWRLHGTQARSSWDHDKPAAGSYSLGAVVMMLGMGSLSGKGEEFLGQPQEQIPAGLGIAAFMNYGGYHSFVETFPCAKAAASNERLEVPVPREWMHSLYDDVLDAVHDYAPDAFQQVDRYHKALHKSHSREIAATLGPRASAIEVHDEVAREVEDPKHRYAAHLNAAWDAWIQTDRTKNLYSWIDENPDITISVYGKDVALKDIPRVAYPDTDERVKQYEVIVKNGKWFRQDGAGVDTIDSPGKADCKGYGVIVIHQDGSAFVHDYKKGSQHHTSTTGGQPVITAGMIKIIEGKATEFRLDTGHYRCGLPQFERMLKFFNRTGVDMKAMRFETPYVTNQAAVADLLAKYVTT
jgi:hypothetical protein